MNSKTYCRTVIIGLLFCLILVGGGTAWIDPYFHYHGPIEGISYYFDVERYVNDGITKNFEYDAIITGSSMTENFKPSEFNTLFDVNSIKVPYAGGRYKEVNDNLRIGLNTHDVKIVLRCLDYTYLLTDKDYIYPKMKAPSYIINDNLFDDVNYIFNKTIFLNYTMEDILRTIEQKNSTTLDDYGSWYKNYACGKENVLKEYKRSGTVTGIQKQMTEKDKKMLDGNLEQNVLNLIETYPETEFYLYFPPYSICFWDAIYRSGQLEFYKELEEYTTEKLLKYDNVHLYNFNNKLEIITDLDNYKDRNHYGIDINSKILEWMRADDGLLTEENYKQYLDNCYETFRTYDYDSVFK